MRCFGDPKDTIDSKQLKNQIKQALKVLNQREKEILDI